jgi:hypothetical protein
VELLIGILILLIYIFGFSGVFRGAKNITKASVKTFTEGGNIVGNLKEEFREMGPFEAQVVKTQIKIGETYEEAYEVSIRGVIRGVGVKSDLVFVTSLFDYTNQEYDYVLCALDFHQEKTTRVFQQVIDAGQISPNQGYKNWVKVATFYPNTLTGKMSGKRIIRVLVRAMPPAEVAQIEGGLHEKDATIYVSATVDEQINLTEKGWKESRLERQQALALTVEAAVGLANLNRPMNEDEGRLIQKWIREQIDSALSDDKEQLKEKLNSSLKQAFTKSSNSTFSFSEVLEQLSKLDFQALNKELMELLIKIINLAPSIDSERMSKINLIGESLNVAYDDIKAMTEKAFLDSGNMPRTEESLEGILGIEESWSKDEINAHLRREFAKWNGRIQSLEDENEKNKAQLMLDAIAAARKKYG